MTNNKLDSIMTRGVLSAAVGVLLLIFAGGMYYLGLMDVFYSVLILSIACFFVAWWAYDDYIWLRDAKKVDDIYRWNCSPDELDKAKRGES